MTVCVIARSLSNQCIVAACDMMLSFSDRIEATEDAELKIRPLGQNWYALYAGDPSNAGAVIRRASAAIKTLPEKWSETEVKSVFTKAYQDELTEQITNRFLSRYRYTIEDFRRRGRGQLGEVPFQNIQTQIAMYNLKTQFLMGGINYLGFPHIFSLDDSSAVTERDGLGFWAIGTGQDMAMASLSIHQPQKLGLRDLVYRVCEAKFNSETAQGVGRSTIAAIWGRNGYELLLNPGQTAELKEVWENERKIVAPDAALEILDRFQVPQFPSGMRRQ